MANKKVSTTALVEYKGETKKVKEWAEQIGMDSKTLAERLENYPIDKAMETPVGAIREGVRTRNIQSLMDALNKVSNELVNGVPRIEHELKLYVADHGLIETYKDLAAFFPKAAQLSLDGDGTESRKVANIIVFGKPSDAISYQ